MQNQVYFFAVTNLKQWVFGVFVSLDTLLACARADEQDPSYTVAHVSPVIERKDREPSLLQCLVSWMVRAVDEVSSNELCSLEAKQLTPAAAEGWRRRGSSPARIGRQHGKLSCSSVLAAAQGPPPV